MDKNKSLSMLIDSYNSSSDEEIVQDVSTNSNYEIESFSSQKTFSSFSSGMYNHVREQLDQIEAQIQSPPTGKCTDNP